MLYKYRMVSGRDKYTYINVEVLYCRTDSLLARKKRYYFTTIRCRTGGRYKSVGRYKSIRRRRSIC